MACRVQSLAAVCSSVGVRLHVEHQHFKRLKLLIRWLILFLLQRFNLLVRVGGFQRDNG